MAIRHYISFWEPGAGANSLRFLRNILTVDTMKRKPLQIPLAVLCFIAIIFAGAENIDGSCNVVWTLSWMAVAFILARLIKRLEDAK